MPSRQSRYYDSIRARSKLVGARSVFGCRQRDFRLSEGGSVLRDDIGQELWQQDKNSRCHTRQEDVLSPSHHDRCRAVVRDMSVREWLLLVAVWIGVVTLGDAWHWRLVVVTS